MTETRDSSDVGTDVVIVGAGISGLAAARELTAQNVHVIVLEARDRVGGRLVSQQVDGVGLDLGATWFWPGESHVLEAIRELDIEVFAHHIEGDAMYHEPQQSKRMDGNPIDVPSGRFVHGADSLTTAIAERLPGSAVRFGEVVESIDGTETTLTVSTADHRYRAQHVVLALPPALAVDAIDFTPVLPERVAGLAAVTPVWMGATTKVVVRYAEPFWRRGGLAGSAISHFGPMRELHDMSGPDGSPAAVFGFAPPSSGGATVRRDDVVAQMIEIFGPEAADPLDVIIMDWRDEPFTSPANVEDLTAYQTFGHELYATPTMGGRLHWSSTETARESPGHIEGAIAAAHRAAASILDNLLATTDNARGNA